MIYLLAEDKGCTVGQHFLEAGAVPTTDDSETTLRINADQFFGFPDTTKLSPVTRKRRVRFSTTVGYEAVPHYTEFTPTEIEQCWNTPEDISSIHAKNRALVTHALRGGKIDEKMDTLRGLEKQLRGNKPSRRFQESLVVVLETQEEFWCDEETDEGSELIRSLYGTISRESAAEALLVGLCDEREAMTTER